MALQVFNKAQMDILRELIFTIPLDMRALCREIATAGLSKGRARSGVTPALTNPPKKVCLQNPISLHLL